MDQYFAGALKVNVALEILRRPAHEARAIMVLIYSSDNVSGDGEPWVITRPLSSLGFGSSFRRAVAGLTKAGLIERQGGSLLVYGSRLVDQSTAVDTSTVDQSTAIVDLSTAAVDTSTGSVDQSTACNKDVRDVEDRRKKKTEDVAAAPASAPRRPPADSPHSRTIDLFDRAYERATDGHRPTWNGKTATATKRLLESHSEEEIALRMARFFEFQVPAFIWKDGVPGFSAFVQHFDSILPPKTPKQSSLADRLDRL